MNFYERRIAMREFAKKQSLKFEKKIEKKKKKLGGFYYADIWLPLTLEIFE